MNKTQKNVSSSILFHATEKYYHFQLFYSKISFKIQERNKLHILECGHWLTYPPSASSPRWTNFRTCDFTEVSSVPWGFLEVFFFFFLAWTMGFHEWSCRILQKKPSDLRWIHWVRCWHFQKRILLMNLSPKYILGCRASGAPSTPPAWGSLAESHVIIQSTKTWCLCFTMKGNAKSTEIWSYCTFPPV